MKKLSLVKTQPGCIDEEVSRGRGVATENLIRVTECDSCASGDEMSAFLTKLLLVVRSRLKSRARLEAEILVLRQQVIVLGRKPRPRALPGNFDRLILVWMYQLFPSILSADICAIHHKLLVLAFFGHYLEELRKET